MASFYRFHKQHKLLIVTCVGLYQPKEAEQTIAAYLKDPNFDPDHDMLIDLSQAHGTDASVLDMQQLAQKIAPKMQHVSRRRCVILATNDLVFGMARMYQQLVEKHLPYPIDIVRNERDALMTLNIDAASFDCLGE